MLLGRRPQKCVGLRNRVEPHRYILGRRTVLEGASVVVASLTGRLELRAMVKPVFFPRSHPLLSKLNHVAVLFTSMWLLCLRSFPRLLHTSHRSFGYGGGRTRRLCHLNLWKRIGGLAALSVSIKPKSVRSTIRAPEISDKSSIRLDTYFEDLSVGQGPRSSQFEYFIRGYRRVGTLQVHTYRRRGAKMDAHSTLITFVDSRMSMYLLATRCVTYFRSGIGASRERDKPCDGF